MPHSQVGFAYKLPSKPVRTVGKQPRVEGVPLFRDVPNAALASPLDPGDRPRHQTHRHRLFPDGREAFYL